MYNIHQRVALPALGAGLERCVLPAQSIFLSVRVMRGLFLYHLIHPVRKGYVGILYDGTFAHPHQTISRKFATCFQMIYVGFPEQVARDTRLG